MAGRLTFKCRKRVIEPAVDVHLCISKLYSLQANLPNFLLSLLFLKEVYLGGFACPFYR